VTRVTRAIEVEKGIPVPERKGRGNEPRYPFADMEVGDSFAMDCDYLLEKRLRGAAAQWSRRNGQRMTVRREGNQCRVWRVS